MSAATTTDAALAALESNLWSMWRQFGLGDGCRLVDEPGLLWFETPLAHMPYNSVMRCRLEDGVDVDATIAAVLAGYRRRRVPVMWLVHPSRRPLDLGERLERHGLEEAELITGMAASLDDVPGLDGDALPGGVRIDEMRPGGEDAYLELLTWRYDLPAGAAGTLRSIMAAARFGEPGSANRSWIARRGGQVLSKATLHQHDGVAGIYGVATRTEARGLGLARLLTLVALDAARRDGAELAVLHSTPAAVSLYQALGFVPAADFHLYAEPDTLHL